MNAGDAAPEEPWLTALQDGDAERAWDLFVSQYRRLIFATIRHYTRDDDEVMDIFADVCGALRDNRLARPQKYWDRPTHTARYSSWLATVVRHLVVDWLRCHGLRQRPQFAASLSGLQQQIFECVFEQGRSHVETYELLRTIDSTLTFAVFAEELRATYRAVDASRWTPVARELAGACPLSDLDAVVQDANDPAVVVDTAFRIASALSSLPADERLAVEMFVVYEMPATTIARALRWPNAKTVYNRVYRALASVRAALKRRGIGREDL